MHSNDNESKTAPYYDCSIRAGYYNLAGIDLAHHTYAVAERNGQNHVMPCFGSFALSEGERGHTGVRYPAELWSPSIIWSRQQGQSLPANLSVALGMAQFSITPHLNWTVAEWEEHWRLNPSLNGYSLASWAGLLYAVTGVCHQACNRILWSSLQGGFIFSAVNWPPSLSASYWVYGFRGKDELAAMILAAALVVKALLGDKADDGELLKSHELAHNVRRHHVDHLLENTTNGEARAHEVQGILDHLPDELKISDPTTVSEIVRHDKVFSNAKNVMDKRLTTTENNLFHDEYAGKVNDDFRTMLNQFRSIMPPATFARLFPDAVDNKNYTLVDRRLMPPNYVRHRNGQHD